MTEQFPAPNPMSMVSSHCSVSKVSLSNASLVAYTKIQNQKYYSSKPNNCFLVHSQHNEQCRIDSSKSIQLNTVSLKCTSHSEDQTINLSSDNLDRYAKQRRGVTKYTLVHSIALLFLLMCTPRSWHSSWLQWHRLLHHILRVPTIVLLMLLAQMHNCSAAGSDCHIPSHSPLNITFDDLAENGVMYGTCLSAPRGSRALQLMVLHLQLPPQAALMVYADGDSHLIHHSCSNYCKKEQGSLKDINTKEFNIQEQENLLLEEVQKLEDSLEKEILNTEKFIASNEKIEERYKRSDLDNILHFGKGAKKSKSMSFEVNIDRDNIEKMTLMKEFESGKHTPKLLKSAADAAATSSCSKCPVFKQHQVIEFYLRLPKALNCSDKKIPCSGRPQLEMVADLDCGVGGGVLVATPAPDSPKSCRISNVNSTTGSPSPAINLQDHHNTIGGDLANARCLVQTCSGHELSEVTGTKKLISLKDRKVIKTRHRAMIRDGGFEKLGHTGTSVESLRQFEVKLPSSAGPFTCFWKLDASSLKYLELNVPSSIRPHVTVFSNNLRNPTWDAGHCPVSAAGSVWLHTEADALYVVYNNPYPTETQTTLSLLQHREGCSFPPDVPFGKHSWHPASTSSDIVAAAGPPHIVYTCDAGYNLQGTAELVCTDGSWPDPPQCVSVPQFTSAASKSKTMSDAPDGTAKSLVDVAVLILNTTADEGIDGGDMKQKMQLADVNITSEAGLSGDRIPESEATDDDENDAEDDEADSDNYRVNEEERGDYYDDYNATEYDYLPEFNATTTAATTSTGSALHIPTPFINSSSSTILMNSFNGNLSSNGSSGELLENTNHSNNNGSSLTSGLEDVRQLLKALSIDDEMLLYLIIGCCGLLLLIIVVTITSIVVYRRRYPVRLGLGRKFDTFQNPIYEKTVVRVPVRSMEEVEVEEEEDVGVDDTTIPALPPASKAEMEDLSDSTVME